MTHALVTNQELRSLAERGPSRVLLTYMGLMDICTVLCIRLLP